MNIPALTCLATLAFLAAAQTEPNRPHAALRSGEPPTPDDQETIRQYSLHLGRQTALMLHAYSEHDTSSYSVNADAVRQAALDNLEKNLVEQEPDQENSRDATLYQQTLRQEERKWEKTFMQENAKRPGIVTLPIGIQYRVIPHPEGKNKRLDEMTACELTTISGRKLDRIQNDTGGYTHILPGILINSSALQNMPKGGTYTFYIPAEHLSPQNRQRYARDNSIIIYTFRPAEQNRAATGPATSMPEENLLQRIPADLRRNFEKQCGKRLAATIQRQWTQGTSQDADLNLVKQTFYRHIGNPASLTCNADDLAPLVRRYETIHNVRQAERDKTFIRNNARKPGVIVLGNGIQYTVEKDPAGRNYPLAQANISKLASLSGTCITFYTGMGDSSAALANEPAPGATVALSSAQTNARAYGMSEILGSAFDSVEPGCKWIFYIPFSLLPEEHKNTLQNSWETLCPEYIVHTFEASASNPPTPETGDGDIDDEASEHSDGPRQFLWDKSRTSEAMAQAEENFLRLNRLTPNVTVLSNGVLYSYITDPDGNNGSIKHVGTMTPYTLAGDSFLSHNHLTLKNTRADGKRIYTHPLIEPYIDTLPEAKKWFFCIPTSLLDPADADWYEQRIGVRLNYILYILETDTKS